MPPEITDPALLAAATDAQQKEITEHAIYTGLAGTDIQVAQLIANLNKSDLFSQVNLVFSEENNTQEENLRHFKLMVTLNADARATEEDVALARQIHVSGM